MRSNEDRTLTERYEGLVASEYRFVYRFLFWLHRDIAVAEDLTQVAFLRAWQSLPQRRAGPESDRAWVAAIARTVSVDHGRKTRRTTVPLSQAAEVHDVRPPVEEQVAADQEQQRLLQALSHLPEAYRAALILTKIEELSTAEAARALGVPQGTVKWRVSRAMHLLRARLGECAKQNDLEGTHAEAVDVRSY